MNTKVIAIVPAAGIGSRMRADVPKQYLSLLGQSIIAHTLDVLLKHPEIDSVIVALHPDDDFFSDICQSEQPKLTTVIGGNTRADSVLAALTEVKDIDAWALVHDAARPCLTADDINKLLASRLANPQGAILAMPVRDTMKRAAEGQIKETVCREQLWHALTPQCFPAETLRLHLSSALNQGAIITDEASAMEWAGIKPALITGRADNIKVTHPDDLALAELFLSRQRSKQRGDALC